MQVSDYEKLGAFYLGRRLGPDHTPLDEPVVIESRDLVTHGVCLGMTGSGKTGLCMALLEEAAIDGVPAIVIDPKGDLANLCLAFPDMSAADVAPFVDPAEAARQGLSVDALADKTAAQWRAGWAATSQGAERVQRYRDAVDVRIYTPGSNAGVPLAPLGSLLPPSDVAADDEARREHCATTAAALLSLVGEDASATAPAHVLLSLLLDDAARAPMPGKRLDLPTLLARVQQPPLQKIGVLDVDTFLPAKERMALVLKLNAVLASPSMAAWLEGEPLDARTLLFAPSGKPRLSIVHVAHLSDVERIAFVARLLGELLAYARAQRGTQSLRALLFIDEVMGYMPPVANPPTKAPLLTLMKQGRAFGVGVLLATQNPVDLDYKALANTGTWMLGRLQTERDRARVLDGLEGASLGADRAQLDALLSSLDKRQFVLVGARGKAPTLFESRTTLSYLAGPLTRPQLRALSGAAASASSSTPPTASVSPAATGATSTAAAASGTRTLVEPGVVERFARGASAGALRPAAYVEARVRYVSAKDGVDVTVPLRLLDRLPMAEVAFRRAEAMRDALDVTDAAPADARFADLPAQAARAKTWQEWRAIAVDEIVAGRPLKLVACRALGVVQTPGMSDAELKAAVLLAAREQRDAEVKKLEARFQPKLDALEEKVRRAQERVRREEGQAQAATLDTAFTVGKSVLGVLFGRKTLSKANLDRAASSAKKAGKALDQRGDVDAARAELSRLEGEAAELDAELEAARAEVHAATPDLETIEVRAKKGDVTIDALWLVWLKD